MTEEEFLADGDWRTVARSVVEHDGEKYRVSTVRLTCDHGRGGTPLWYETMVFPMDGWGDLFCERYSTRDQAVAGHQVAVETWTPSKEST